MPQSDNVLTETRSLDRILHAPAREEPVGFLLRLSKALHTYGLPAYELENTMNGCAEAMGYGIQCMSLPTSINMTFMPPDGDARTYVIRVAPGEINLEKLRKTTEIAQLVIDGNLSSKEGAHRLKEIAQSQSLYPGSVVIAAYSVVSAGITRIFSGSVEDMVVAAFIGAVVGIFFLMSRSRPLLAHTLPSVCAFSATIMAVLMAHYGVFQVVVSVAVVSGLIILLPGLTLTIAMAELATQNMVSGTARLTAAMTVFIQLAFGSALAMEAGRVFGLDYSAVQVSDVPLWSVWCGVGMAGIGLIPTFEARFKDSIWFFLSAVTAFTTVYYSGQILGASLGAFCGAICVGILARFVTRLFSVPGAMVMMPGFIILVPGSVGYRSILALVDKDIVGGLEAAVEVAIIGISLVAGFLLSSMLPLPKDSVSDQY